MNNKKNNEAQNKVPAGGALSRRDLLKGAGLTGAALMAAGSGASHCPDFHTAGTTCTNPCRRSFRDTDGR
jgi:hypothetical protein